MINSNITLKKIEIFLSFMAKGNIGAVAEELNLSTVSVHRALHSLEDGMSCPLFIHKGRILKPLPAAYTLAEYAKEIIELTVKAVEATCQCGGGNQKKLKMGTIYSLTLETVPRLVMDFKLRKPDTSIDLVMGSNQELLDKLENGLLDAALISLSGFTLDKSIFEVQPLFKDDLFMAGPINSTLMTGKAAYLHKFKNENFISLGEGFATYHSFNEIFEHADFKPAISMFVNDIFSLINLVQAGVGFSLLPGRINRAYSGTIKMLPIEGQHPVSQIIGLIFLRRREKDPCIRALLAASRMYALNHHQPIEAA